MRRLWLPFTAPKALISSSPQEEHMVGSVPGVPGPVLMLKVRVELHILDLQFKSYMKYQINIVQSNSTGLSLFSSNH